MYVNAPKDKYLFDLTFNDFDTHRQKLSIILENKVFQNSKLSKSVANKKRSPKLIIFNEK